MGAVKMIDDAADGKTEGNYEFTISAAPDEIRGKMVTKELDIAAIPTNVASVLYNKTEGGVQLLAINTLGVLYMLENGNSINSVEDLRGKTIGATGQGSNPEYVLNYVLEKNGLKVGTDVTVKYYATHDELATLMASGDIAAAMLPQPNVTAVMAKNADIRIALDMSAEWDKVSDDGQLAMGCVAVRTEFAKEHPQAVATFLKEYEASVKYVKENVQAASELIAEYGIMAAAPLAAKAIPNCNLTFIAGDELKSVIDGYYKVLFAAAPASIGGKVPDDGFYYAQ